MKKYLVIPISENRELKLLFESKEDINLGDMWVCNMTDEAMRDIQHYHCNEVKIKTKEQ